jgi:hypothetical protein
MDWFNSFLFYKSYANVQAVGWVFFAVSILANEYATQAKNELFQSFFTNIIVFTVLLFAGTGFVHMWIQFFQ